MQQSGVASNGGGDHASRRLSTGRKNAIRSDYSTFAHKEGNRAGQRVTVTQVNKCDADSSTRIFVCARPSRRKERRRRNVSNQWVCSDKTEIAGIASRQSWQRNEVGVSQVFVLRVWCANATATIKKINFGRVPCHSRSAQRCKSDVNGESTNYNKEIARGQECFLDHQQQWAVHALLEPVRNATKSVSNAVVLPTKMSRKAILTAKSSACASWRHVVGMAKLASIRWKGGQVTGVVVPMLMSIPTLRRMSKAWSRRCSRCFMFREVNSANTVTHVPLARIAHWYSSSTWHACPCWTLEARRACSWSSSDRYTRRSRDSCSLVRRNPQGSGTSGRKWARPPFRRRRNWAKRRENSPTVSWRMLPRAELTRSMEHAFCFCWFNQMRMSTLPRSPKTSSFEL